MLSSQNIRRTKVSEVSDWFARTNPEVARAYNGLVALCSLIESEAGQSESPFHSTLDCIIDRILAVSTTPPKILSAIMVDVQSMIDKTIQQNLPQEVEVEEPQQIIQAIESSSGLTQAEVQSLINTSISSIPPSLTKLIDLSDVSGVVSNGATLVFNTTSGKFEITPPSGAANSLVNLVDVDGVPVGGALPIYNENSSKFEITPNIEGGIW